MKSTISKGCFIVFFVCANMLLSTMPSFANAPSKQFYQLVIYHIENKTQEERIDNYLADAYLPAVHRSGIKTVGVFKTANIDTASDKRVYVFIPYQSLKQFHETTQLLDNDAELAVKGKDYLNASYDDAPYSRKESILLEAFSGMPMLKKPSFTSPKSERIYELRSYESATEKLYLNKVQMFNEDEMEIFERIGSQPVFYGKVLAGSHMPNLMYMTSYSTKSSRDEHWKTFGDDPKWKRISALPQYQHNTSKAVIQFLTPTEYSDL